MIFATTNTTKPATQDLVMETEKEAVEVTSDRKTPENRAETDRKTEEAEKEGPLEVETEGIPKEIIARETKKEEHQEVEKEDTKIETEAQVETAG